MNQDRDWTVLLIGGPSGTGKSSIAHALARHYGISVLEIDDVGQAVRAVTTVETLPALHSGADWREIGVAANVDWLIRVGRELAPALLAVIENHLEGRIPVIIEGDFLEPAFCAHFQDPKVKALFLTEEDEDQIVRNYLAREGENPRPSAPPSAPPMDGGSLGPARSKASPAWPPGPGRRGRRGRFLRWECLNIKGRRPYRIREDFWMDRYAWKARLKPGMLPEYRRRHDDLWPEMADLLREAGIVNYSIWTEGETLFGYYECALGLEHAARVQAQSPVVDRWNAYMRDVMEMEMDPETGAQPLLTEVFRFE